MAGLGSLRPACCPDVTMQVRIHSCLSPVQDVLEPSAPSSSGLRDWILPLSHTAIDLHTMQWVCHKAAQMVAKPLCKAWEAWKIWEPVSPDSLGSPYGSVPHSPLVIFPNPVFQHWTNKRNRGRKVQGTKLTTYGDPWQLFEPGFSQVQSPVGERSSGGWPSTGEQSSFSREAHPCSQRTLVHLNNQNTRSHTVSTAATPSHSTLTWGRDSHCMELVCVSASLLSHIPHTRPALVCTQQWLFLENSTKPIISLHKME
jgi:hypothetical protein